MKTNKRMNRNSVHDTHEPSRDELLWQGLANHLISGLRWSGFSDKQILTEPTERLPAQIHEGFSAKVLASVRAVIASDPASYGIRVEN